VSSRIFLEINTRINLFLSSRNIDLENDFRNIGVSKLSEFQKYRSFKIIEVPKVSEFQNSRIIEDPKL